MSEHTKAFTTAAAIVVAMAALTGGAGTNDAKQQENRSFGTQQAMKPAAPRWNGKFSNWEEA